MFNVKHELNNNFLKIEVIDSNIIFKQNKTSILTIKIY